MLYTLRSNNFLSLSVTCKMYAYNVYKIPIVFQGYAYRFIPNFQNEQNITRCTRIVVI